MTVQTAASRVSIKSLRSLSPVKMRESTLVSIRNSAMPAISLSKLASNFVGRFFAIGPNVQDFVVRYDLLRPADSFSFKLFQFLDYIRGSFSIRDSETAPHFEGQFNNNFSHGADLLSDFELYHTSYAPVRRRLIRDTIKQ